MDTGRGVPAHFERTFHYQTVARVWKKFQDNKDVKNSWNTLRRPPAPSEGDIHMFLVAFLRLGQPL